MQAANASIPRYNNVENPHYKSHLWWNDRCEEVVNNKKAALREYYSNKCTERFRHYRECVRIAQETIIQEKQIQWRQFCQLLSTADCANTSIWKLLRHFSGNKKKTGKFIDPNEFPELSQAVLRKLNTTILDNSEDQNITPTPLTREGTTQIEIEETENRGSLPPTGEATPIVSQEQNENIPPLTMVELEAALSRIKKKTAPGVDGVTYEMIINLPVSAKRVLLKFYNFCLTNSYPMKDWKVIKILYLKKNLNIPLEELTADDIRPLALISCFAKVINMMLNARLETLVEKLQILPTHAHGFRKQHGTQNNLTELQMAIVDEKIKGNSTQCIFLDISGAYNRVNLQKLKSIMLENNLVP